MIDIQEIPPEKINYSSSNIRSVIDETGPLADSMEAHGQLEPGTGWWEEDRFRIATGHRRAEACRHLGIPFLARIIEAMPDPDLIEYQLVENIQAEALIPDDLERAVEALMRSCGSHREVGRRIGKSPQWVSTILGAREVKASLSEKKDALEPTPDPAVSMATTTAAQFGRLKDEDNRRAAFEEAVRRNKGEGNLPRALVDSVVEEYRENEIRDVQAYIWKLQQERVKLIRKRADIEAEIDRIDSKIARLSKK